MLLQEMFSPLGGPREDEQSVDWTDDLKFFIDNDNDLLNKYILPTVMVHKKYVNHPDAYKLYLKPIQKCCESYADTFEVEDIEEKIPGDKLEELARHICDIQRECIKNGDYN